MIRTYVKELKSGEKKVMIEGWTHEIRDLAKMKFLLLRDSTGIVQCVVKGDELINECKELTLESVVMVIGVVKKANVKAELARSDVEVFVESIEILNKAETLPIQVNEKTITTELPTRLDYRYLDIRKPRVMAIFKIQNVIINSFRKYFYHEGFIEAQTPSIISASSEGGTELFKIKYFDKEAYLAQSPQLYKQLCAISWEKVFLTTPVWRAEKHDTTKHINEIRQLDIEVAFTDDKEIMKYLEEVMKFIVQEVLEKCGEEIALLGMEGKIKVPKTKYLTYHEAIKILNNNGVMMKDGEDFEPEAERKLCELYPDTLVFTYEWPSMLKPFYIWPKQEKGKEGLSGGFDMLYGGIELTSGGQRIHKPEILIKQLKAKGLRPEDFKWYIDAFRYGAPMHSGWSIGLERLTQALLKLDNIREATLFPRDRKRLTP